MKFAELHAGQVLEAGPYRVDEEEMLRFAKAYDPQWFHVDPEAELDDPELKVSHERDEKAAEGVPT